MSKLTRIIAIILFLAVGGLSFLPTLRISFAERPAEIPQEAADQLLDGLVKDAGGMNPISMHGLDSFAKKPGEEASGWSSAPCRTEAEIRSPPAV